MFRRANYGWLCAPIQWRATGGTPPSASQASAVSLLRSPSATHLTGGIATLFKKNRT